MPMFVSSVAAPLPASMKVDVSLWEGVVGRLGHRVNALGFVKRTVFAVSKMVSVFTVLRRVATQRCVPSRKMSARSLKGVSARDDAVSMARFAWNLRRTVVRRKNVVLKEYAALTLRAAQRLTTAALGQKLASKKGFVSELEMFVLRRFEVV